MAKIRRMTYGHVNGEGELWDDPKGTLTDYCDYAELRAALEHIRDGNIIQGMSPAMFAEKVLASQSDRGVDGGN